MKYIINCFSKKMIYILALLILLIFSGNAFSNNIKDSMITLYSNCINENGGISNGSISYCTSLVNNKIDEEIAIIISNAIASSRIRVDINNDSLVKYDQEMTDKLNSSIYRMLLHTAELCTYFSYNIGGPAGPICNMNFRLNLLDELSSLEQD
ncbi:hypothetical protein [Nitrincola tapanii]|uniref:DUF1311 domain-containing protein n=1 Tax=Nitrincola tapanii TaxID=1708751 RepID=A0A5A9W3H8_9GAMM|nr:hypothetical protein [Nitrincola tapanii]KAA0875320.1 hypothetical protein E1H14_04815 [Nitrincola tapanii]